MIYRMTAAVLSLAGFFISAYLYLYKIGRIGTLACGAGECDTVQQSPWSRIAGFEVSLIGLAGYAVLLVLSLTSLQPAVSTRRWPANILLVLAGLGVAFSIYLTYLEFFVIHAVCRWCVGSAVIIVGIFLAAVFEQRRLARLRTTR
jgi:uncharacterized membrane protein